MRWRRGDIISGRLKAWMPYAEHWMLAVDEDHVINMVGDTETGRGPIRLQRREETSGFDKNCCQNRGRGPRGKAAVDKAMRMQDKTYFYNLYTSNCEHYVRYWTGMDVNSNQSMMPLSPRFREEVRPGSKNGQEKKSFWPF